MKGFGVVVSALLLILAGCGGTVSGGGGVPTGPTQSNIPLAISSISPRAANAGDPAFTLTVDGTGFDKTSYILWDWTPLPTTYVSDTELQATVPAADVAQAGSGVISVRTPDHTGGNAAEVILPVGYSMKVMNLLANGLVWDGLHGVMYASVPAASNSHPNTVAAIDPAIAAVVATASAGTDPDALSLSDDDAFLYVGEDGSNAVERFLTSGMSADITVPMPSGSLGQYYPLALAAAPGAPHTFAVSLGILNLTGVGGMSEGGVMIYDDSTARATSVPGFDASGKIYNGVAWGADATTLYSSDAESTSADFYVLSVAASGVSIGHDYMNDFSSSGGTGSNVHYDAGTGLVYADDAFIINPSDGSLAAEFVTPTAGDVSGNSSCVVTPDSAIDTVFIACVGADPNASQAGTTLFISSFDQTTHALRGSIVMPGVDSRLRVTGLVPLGTQGLAVATQALSTKGYGTVYIVTGAFSQ